MRHVRLMAGVLTLAVVQSAALGAGGLEERIGKDYVVIVCVNDAGALKAGIEKTALWATWQEPDIQRFLALALASAEEGIAKALGLSSKELFAQLPGQAVFALAPGPAAGNKGGVDTQPAAAPESELRSLPAEALTTRPFNPMGAMKMVFLVRLGGAKAVAERILEKQRKDLGPDAVKREQLPDGTAVEVFPEDVYVAMKDDLLAVGNKMEVIAEALAGPLPAEKQLVETPTFKATMKPFGQPPAESLYSYVDISAVLAIEAQEDAAVAQAGAVFDALGIREIKAVATLLRPAGRQYEYQTHVYAPGWTKGLLSPFGKGARALLKTVPPDAVGAGAASIDLLKFFDLIASAEEALGDERFTRGLQVMKERVGFDIRDDLVAALGTDTVWYVFPAEQPAVSMLPRIVIDGNLRQRDRLVKSLDVLGKMLEGQVAGGAVPVQYQREEKDGTVWHSVWMAVPAVQAVVAVGPERLVIATRKADAEAALARGGKPLEKSFLDSPSVAQGLDRVGGDGAVLMYVDSKPLAASTIGTVAALTLPAMMKAREAARRVECAAALRMVGFAVMTYATANNDKLPASLDELAKGGHFGPAGGRVPTCPNGHAFHYVAYAKKLEDLKPQAVLAYELGTHDGRRNVVFADGHVEMLDAAGFAKALAEVPEELRAKDEPPASKPAASMPAPGELPAIPGLGPMPAVAVWTKHLTPTVSGTAVTPDGLLYREESFVASGLFSGMTGPGMMMPMMLMRATAMPMPVAPPAGEAVACRKNLQMLGLTVTQYVMDHDGKLPATLGDLKDLLPDDPKDLQCPDTGKPFHIIFYKDKKSTDLPATTWLAYELPPGHGGRRNVLFTDGHVDLLTEEQIKKGLEAVPADLRGPADGGTSPAVSVPPVRPPVVPPVTPGTADPTPGTTVKVLTPQEQANLDKQMESWLSMARSYFDRDRYDRCEEYCLRILAKAKKNSLMEIKAQHLLETCRRQKAKN